MADKDKGGDKTELPTPKKLKDAREKGDIAKSREITAAVGTFGWLAVVLVLGSEIAGRIATYSDRVVIAAASADFAGVASGFALEGVLLLITVVCMAILPITLLNTISELLQTRGLFATKKLTPKFENLNPAEGFKRLFGKQGLVELVKTLAKAAAVVAIVWLVSRSHLDGMGEMLLPASLPLWEDGAGAAAAMSDADLTLEITLKVLGAVAVVFAGVAVLDAAWTRHSFTRRMMMSRRDIKQEVKQDEGDPHIRSHRRQLAQEWAQGGAIAATGSATALLVNPTHIAIALDYSPEKAPVPVVAARGEGSVAQAMRHEAERAGVPIVRHIPTARALWARGEVGEIVPEELFDAIAEVILWAKRARDGHAPMLCDLQRQREENGDAGNAASRAQTNAPNQQGLQHERISAA